MYRSKVGHLASLIIILQDLKKILRDEKLES